MSQRPLVLAPACYDDDEDEGGGGGDAGDAEGANYGIDGGRGSSSDGGSDGGAGGAAAGAGGGSAAAPSGGSGGGGAASFRGLSVWAWAPSRLIAVPGGAALAVAAGERLAVSGAAVVAALAGHVEVLGYAVVAGAAAVALHAAPWDGAAVLVFGCGGGPGCGDCAAAGGGGGTTGGARREGVSAAEAAACAALTASHPGSAVVLLRAVPERAGMLARYNLAAAGADGATEAAVAAAAPGLSSARVLFAPEGAVDYTRRGGWRLLRRAVLVPGHWAAAAERVVGGGGGGGVPGVCDAAFGIVPCGAKGVGKSTFGIYLLNRILSLQRRRGAPTGVALLDVDVGQPELGPPGLIGLHVVTEPLLVPPFMRATAFSTRAAYFIGDVSHKHDPRGVGAAVAALVAEYRAAAAGRPLPLLVNTPGWVRGLGLDLLSAVLAAVEPAHVVMLLGTSAGKVFDVEAPPRAWLAVPAGGGGGTGVRADAPLALAPCVHRVAAWCDDGAGGGGGGGGGEGGGEGDGAVQRAMKAPAELREMRLVSYFLGVGAAARVAGEPGAAARAFAVIPPFVVPFACVWLRVVHMEVLPSLCLRALNGCIVGLGVCERALPAPLAPGRAHAGLPRFLARNPVAPTVRCVGLGVVRSIDAEACEFHIVCPLDPRDAVRVNVLLRGALEVPMSLVSLEGVFPDPYVAEGAVAVAGAGGMKSRNSIKRRRL